MNDKSRQLMMGLVVLVAASVGAFYYGKSIGYKQAQDDIKSLQDAAAQKAAQQAAGAANPFKAVNPLQNVQSNPLKNAVKVLNPF